MSPPGYPDNETNEEFSFILGDIGLTLRENNVQDELTSLPLKVLSDETEVLGSDSDTFAGSSVRTVKYGSFTVKLFAPKDAPDNFWILQMTSTDEGVKTQRGIAVGDTLTALLEKYPEAAVLEWDNSVYRYSGSQSDSLEELLFTVSEGVVTQITMTYNLP